jgi:hypothetical protein
MTPLPEDIACEAAEQIRTLLAEDCAVGHPLTEEVLLESAVGIILEAIRSAVEAAREEERRRLAPMTPGQMLEAAYECEPPIRARSEEKKR